MTVLAISILAASVAYQGSFEDRENWEVDNPNDYLTIDVGGTHEGGACLYIGGPKEDCDNAWRVQMKGKIPVPPGSRGWKLDLEAACTRLLPRTYGTGKAHCNEIIWYDAAGKQIDAEALPFGVVPGGFQDIRTIGPVPDGVAFCSLKFGIEYMDLKPGQRTILRKMRLSFVDAASKERVPPIARMILDRKNWSKFAARPDIPSKALAGAKYESGSVGSKAEVRDDGVTLIDGKPFFPIGIYAVRKCDMNHNSFDEAFKGLSEAGFNLTQNYEDPHNPELLAAAAKYGVKLWMWSRKPDEWFLNEGRKNPSILAWYLGDDTCVSETANGLRTNHDLVKAADPLRLTCQADGVGTEFVCPSYADFVNGTDVYMPEIYSVMGHKGDKTDFSCVAKVIDDMEWIKIVQDELGQGPHACWPILQCFNGWGLWKHYPSREQIFATAFAAIVHGARGITWFIYASKAPNEGATSSPERWKDMCELATWFRDLTPALVARDTVQPPPAKILSGPEVDAFDRVPVSGLLRVVGRDAYFITVNAANESVRARFRIPGVQGSAEVQKENRRVKCPDGLLEDLWAPFAVHVYRFSTK